MAILSCVVNIVPHFALPTPCSDHFKNTVYTTSCQEGRQEKFPALLFHLPVGATSSLQKTLGYINLSFIVDTYMPLLQLAAY